MNIAELFIKRPVTTTLIMLAILIFGFMGYRRLPVSELPNVDFPTLLVEAYLPGASPETMAASVATPLEKQFSTIAGISNMSSSSLLGLTRITIQFELDRNLDAAAQDVQAAITRTAPKLPKDMPYPPSYRKVNPADQPVLYLGLTSSTMPTYTLNEYGETMISQRLSTVSGVAQVLIYGAQKYAVRIKVDPKALASRGLGLNEVSQAIQTANVNLPTGTLDGTYQSLTVETKGQLTRAKDYQSVIVAYRNGRPVRLKEIGEALDSVETEKVVAWLVDQRAIILAIQRQPGTNTVEVSDEVKKLLPTFRRQLPSSVSLVVLYDRSESIKESVQDVKFTLVFTLGLVVVVIFLFLRRIRATIIPSLAMPMSIVGTFAVMYLLDYSLDNLSLMALILSVGFVVDDAIVMLENIIRHIEMGKGVREASLEGSREINSTIVSMTISLAAVFIPVLFMGGIIGRLFKEFAVTIGVSVLISGFIALTLTPMLCSRFLKADLHQKKPGRLYQASEAVFDRMLWFYSKALRFVLRHRRLTMIFTAIVLAASVYLFRILPKGFIPSSDTGQIFAMTEAVQGISFQAMIEHQKAAAAIVARDPAISVFMSSIGGGSTAGMTNAGVMFMRLKPMEERQADVEQIIARLRPPLAQLTGFKVYIQNPPPLRLGGVLTKSQYQYTIQGSDTQELYQYAGIMEEKLKTIPGLVDVTSDLQMVNPQVTVEIDRDKTAVLGLTAQQIEDALYSAYGTRQISTIYAPNNDYMVILEVKPEFKNDPNDLSLMQIRSSSGRLIPLDAVVKRRTGVGPLSVNHLGQLPAVTLSFNLRLGAALGDAVTLVEKAAKEILPATITTSFQGTAQAFQASMTGMGLLLFMAVVVIYLVLGILYESFIHPITILSALPFAGFGALVTLLIFGRELSIYAFVGVVMLVGLVKKNGIMMVDFAIEARKHGKSPSEAIYEACQIRFRPIMMTTMAALVGTLPIALGYGAGGEARQPLGLAVVGGLFFSQMLTLLVTPIFYIYMEGLQGRLDRLRLRLTGKGKGLEPAEHKAPPTGAV